MDEFLFSSEQVSEGHPDKVCDQVSDNILDAILAQDPKARVAIDCAIKNNTLVLLGEISTTATVDYEKVVRDTLRDIGYEDAETSCDWRTIEVKNHVSQQSPEIYQAVFRPEELCAGDQGIMFGYATQETRALVPATHLLATRLAMRLADVRKKGVLTYLRPDSKTQVTMRYRRTPSTHFFTPVFIDTIVISTMHAAGVDNGVLRNDIFREVIIPTLDEVKSEGHISLDIELPGVSTGALQSFDLTKWTPTQIAHNYGIPLTEKQYTKILVNPSDCFVIGGPKGDSGLTGRKIIADSYGGFGSHGGGAFSGKDASKVDRSGAYLARNIALSLCAPENNICRRCLVQLGYAIGIAEPVSIFIDMYDSETDPRYKDHARLERAIRRTFEMTPGAIIRDFGLDKPVFGATSRYGHFGRDFPWERPRKLDFADE
ncbi:S-adenosylmethionine synthetase [Giardia muris]|uniref:methionine adenosyltransferase n=1 Tax=Giardia muris TaxID=5742 RepID=A0A4Z1STP3_GIAMU|nr:S-adenosylmethionine synthetase [Giardia muris]|eukprot:TNJ27008.1 S-adenosylmethionine synthetase [Giardia muris]